jgi:hypothetical protein
LSAIDKCIAIERDGTRGGALAVEDVGEAIMGPNAYTVFFHYKGKTISNTTFTVPGAEDPMEVRERSDQLAIDRLLGIVDFDWLQG